jgi:hypothetical protein
MVDAMAYAVAAQIAYLQNEYVLMHIKPCPWWMPNFVYRWLLSKFIYLRMFRKPKTLLDL